MVPARGRTRTVEAKSDAYQQLRTLLLGGEVRPGQRLSHRSLARDLGLSSSPVRKALLALEAAPETVSVALSTAPPASALTPTSTSASAEVWLDTLAPPLEVPAEVWVEVCADTSLWADTPACESS